MELSKYDLNELRALYICVSNSCIDAVGDYKKVLLSWKDRIQEAIIDREFEENYSFV